MFPVARSAFEAVSAPLGFAPREREASALLKGLAVRFAVEPLFHPVDSEECALALVGSTLPIGCSIVPMALAAPGSLRPECDLSNVAPVNRNGKRWPTERRPGAPRTGFSVIVKFWAPVDASATMGAGWPTLLSRQPDELSPAELRTYVQRPQSVNIPQSALDVGLFAPRESR